MVLARVVRKITSTCKHPAYTGRPLYTVQPVHPDSSSAGEEWVAMDVVGAGIGDIVVCGGAPGVAAEVLKLERAPVRTLIIAIVDRVDYRDIA